MISKRLGELLLQQGYINREQLAQALEHHKKNRGRLGASLVQLGHINERVLATFLSQQYGVPAISLDGVKIPADLTGLVPRSVCEKHHLVPLKVEQGRLVIAISDPGNAAALDDLRFLCNMEVTLFLSTESAIKSAIEKAYAGTDETFEAQQISEESDGNTTTFDISSSARDAPEMDNASVEKPVIRLINKLFTEALRRKCSDVHIEPFEKYTRVRFRIDGSLYEVMRLPPQLRSATPARLKVMASLDISEKRLPQDGRLQLKTQDRAIDVRVSILPTMFGEKVVMRLLDSGSSAPDITRMGFEEEQLALFRRAVEQPYGMILVTGPTGSGKSTSLYAILNELNSEDVNISTVEDPIEYHMAGVNQTQMKEAIGMTFAAALRSLLRQDPDIIMVGEIRDQETAEISIKAALTGHLVLSTLHTNDASSTVTRLIHMGIEPFLITAALTLVQAQRLVRHLCPNCKEPDDRITPEELIRAEVPENWIGHFTPMRGVGCDQCNESGFKGRAGIFETLALTEKLRDLIIKGANADQIKMAAIEDGLITLRRSAVLKLYRGETTLDEVLKNSRPDGDL